MTIILHPHTSLNKRLNCSSLNGAHKDDNAVGTETKQRVLVDCFNSLILPLFHPPLGKKLTLNTKREKVKFNLLLHFWQNCNGII